MSSTAAANATSAFVRANILRSAAASPLNKRSAHAQIYYHAALAIFVAGWDAYLKEVIVEFFGRISNPLDPHFHAMSTLGKDFADNARKKFNTPNFENSRELLVKCTGYDPYGDWIWTRRKLSVLQVQERLNQILKVRHSFAHGSPIPAFLWTQSKGGKVRLTNQSVHDVEALLTHLIMKTDLGLLAHMKSVYGIPKW